MMWGIRGFPRSLIADSSPLPHDRWPPRDPTPDQPVSGLTPRFFMPPVTLCIPQQVHAAAHASASPTPEHRYPQLHRSAAGHCGASERYFRRAFSGLLVPQELRMALPDQIR